MEEKVIEEVKNFIGTDFKKGLIVLAILKGLMKLMDFIENKRNAKKEIADVKQ